MSDSQLWVIIYRRREAGQGFVGARSVMAENLGEAKRFGSEAEALAHVDAN